MQEKFMRNVVTTWTTRLLYTISHIIILPNEVRRLAGIGSEFSYIVSWRKIPSELPSGAGIPGDGADRKNKKPQHKCVRVSLQGM